MKIKITRTKLRELIKESKEEYEKFFKATLKKFNVSSPNDLDDDKKKAFFNYIEKNWKAANENITNETKQLKREANNLNKVAKMSDNQLKSIWNHASDIPASRAFGQQLKLIAAELKKRNIPLSEQIALDNHYQSINEATIKFNFNKMMKLIESDKFLKYVFESNKESNEKKKAEQIFNDHVLGDSKLEKKYEKI